MAFLLRIVVFSYCARVSYCSSEGDLYAVLGVPPSAEQAEIKRAYRRLAKVKHPDVNKAPGAEEEFIRLTEAHETLSDPAARRDYDRRLRVQRARHQHGAHRAPPRREYPGYTFTSPDALISQINGEQTWVIHVYTHRGYQRGDFFGNWMSQLPGMVKLGHVNMGGDVETGILEIIRSIMSGHGISFPFLFVCRLGQVLAFKTERSVFFDNTLEAVLQHVLMVVNYGEWVMRLEDDEHLRAFLSFRPGGASRLRIVFVVGEGERGHPEELFEAFQVAHEMQQHAFVAELFLGDVYDASSNYYLGEFFAELGLRSVPAAVVYDPVSGARHVFEGTRHFRHIVGHAFSWIDANAELSGTMLVQEMDQESLERRCGSAREGHPKCDWVFAMVTDQAFEADAHAVSQAMDDFSKACQTLAILRARLSWSFACFWLRLQRAPEWGALLQQRGAWPGPSGSAGASAVALGSGRVSGAPSWGSRSLYTWFRRAAERGGACRGCCTRWRVRQSPGAWRCCGGRCGA